ncbi:hypothetical protein [Helicobacter pylori]|uniref:hypothetical protein n=1 Tax=Helicobacter pylori TaxID=210 RepID=UPI0036F41A7F
MDFTIDLLYFKKKKKRILGYFNLFIFEALIFVTIKSSFESYHRYLMGKSQTKTRTRSSQKLLYS